MLIWSYLIYKKKKKKKEISDIRIEILNKFIQVELTAYILRTF